MSGISRTQVYRLLDQLKQKGLVEEVIDENRRLAKAVSPDQLSKLVYQHEQISRKLQQDLPQVQNLLHSLQAAPQPGTKVSYYRGRSGIHHMLYNILDSQTEIVGYTYVNLTPFTGKKFARYFAEEFAAAKLTMRDIYSDTYLDSIGGPDELKRNDHGFLSKHPTVTSRYLPREKLNIDHQIDIHDDTVSIYDWHENEIFGIEITNQKVANLQRQIFELLWNQATPEEDLIPHHPPQPQAS